MDAGQWMKTSIPSRCRLDLPWRAIFAGLLWLPLSVIVGFAPFLNAISAEPKFADCRRWVEKPILAVGMIHVDLIAPNLLLTAISKQDPRAIEAKPNQLWPGIHLLLFERPANL